MMDIVNTVLTAGVGLTATGVTYLIGRVIEGDKRLAVHEETDKVALQGLNTTLTDLKTMQRDQTQKLDKLVEHLITKR